MSNIFTLRCESCGGQLTTAHYPLVCTFCGAENWAKDTFSFSEQRAVANLRLIHSAEATFLATFGNCSYYGSAAELFQNALIPAPLAEASGVPKMTNDAGIECAGANTPLAGYRYQWHVSPTSDVEPAAYSASAFVDVAVHERGVWNFFVNETGVIRFSQQHIPPDRNSAVFDVNLEHGI